MQQIDIKFTDLKTGRTRNVVIKKVSDNYAKKWLTMIVGVEMLKVLNNLPAGSVYQKAKLSSYDKAESKEMRRFAKNHPGAFQ